MATTEFIDAYACHIGKTRDNNEDYYKADPTTGIWVLADGMGGHDAGEIASKMAADSIAQSVSQGVKLETAILNADFEIKSTAQKHGLNTNMGTTIAALYLQAQHYEIAWVGDSRIYVFAHDTGVLTQLTTDHSYVQSLYEAGVIKAEEMRTHEQRNVITQSLGCASSDAPQVAYAKGLWSPRHTFLLCSDGLSDLVTDEEITEILAKPYMTEEIMVKRLLNLALQYGGTDNITIGLVSTPNKVSVKHSFNQALNKLIRRK